MTATQTTWFDHALDKAREAGWSLKWDTRNVHNKTNYGPRTVRTEHIVTLHHPDGRRIGDESIGINLDAAAWVLCQRLWPCTEDLPEETAA